MQIERWVVFFGPFQGLLLLKKDHQGHPDDHADQKCLRHGRSFPELATFALPRAQFYYIISASRRHRSQSVRLPMLERLSVACCTPSGLDLAVSR